jgi:hypothetical protein
MSGAVGVQINGEKLLFRVSQGGGTDCQAGLWGRHVLGTTHLVGPVYGYETGGGTYPFDLVSYDPHDVSVLMVQTGYAGIAVRSWHVTYGPLCDEGHGDVKVLLDHVVLVNPENPFLLDPDCGNKCGIGAIAHLRSRIYFILSAVLGNDQDSLHHEIHLRLLEGCGFDQLPIQPWDENTIDILKCSTLIAVLHNEEFKKPTPKLTMWSTPGIKVVSGDGSETHTFVQVISSVRGHIPYMSLLHVTSSGSVTVLFHQDIDTRYASLLIHGLGSVDYRGGILCWTTADQLLCDDVDIGALKANNRPAKILDPEILVHPGEALSQDICTGTAILSCKIGYPCYCHFSLCCPEILLFPRYAY